MPNDMTIFCKTIKAFVRIIFFILCLGSWVAEASDPKPITLLTLIGSYTPQMLRFQIPTHRPVYGEGITCQFFTSVLGFPPQ